MSQGNVLNRCRSFVLVSVLIIVAGALLVATSLIFSTQTQSMSAAVSADAIQIRALAWSGLQAVMSRLNEQRETMLAGEMPEIESQFEIYQTSSRVGLVRLIAFDGAGDQRLIAESGKLDLNSAGVDALVKTGMLDAAVAAAIVENRENNNREYQSLAELLAIPQSAVTAEMLYGPLDQFSLLDDAQRSDLGLNQRVAARLGAAPVIGLDKVVGIHNVEPALQQNGQRQINLNASWSEELAERIEERFGAESVQLIKQIYEGGEKFESDAKIIKSLRDFKVPPENWPPILDAFTTESGEYHFGRVNINVAPAEVLRALPGVTPEQASQMVSIREELSPQERATIAWPAMAQILPPESYDQLAGKITTRAFTFRIRFAAGEVEAADTAGTMVNRMVYEAVIDLSAPTPRIAYLRDVTQWQATIEIAMQQPSTFDVSDEEGLDETPGRTADHAASQPGAADTQPEAASPNQTPAISSSKPQKPNATQDPNQQRRRIGRWTTGTMNGQ